jgi:hypothetical protein
MTRSEANKVIDAVLEEEGLSEKVNEMSLTDACEFYNRIYYAAGIK